MWNILSLVNKIRVGIAAIFAKFTPAPAEKSA
jgi:hypothetical protein